MLHALNQFIDVVVSDFNPSIVTCTFLPFCFLVIYSSYYSNFLFYPWQSVDKAKGELLKVRKKSQRKKPTEKYEDKEKQVKHSILMFTANKDFIQILF